MAKLRTLFPFTGTLQGATAYTRKDLPGTVLLRSVTGPSREAVRTHPSFANTRRNNREFGGRATASGWIRRALYPLRHLEDYNVAAALNSLLRPVQQADTDSPFGRRSVCLSRQPYLLEGFNLNRKHSLETTVRHPLVWTLSKETLSARVELPALLAGVNFLAPPPHPWFRLAALLGVVPDLYCEGSKYRPHGD